MNVANYKAIMH